MSVDPNAFRDRVLADVIAAPLRDPTAFGRASVFAQWEDTEAYVRGRAAAHSEDLAATEVETQAAIDQAVDEWQRLFGGDRRSYRVIAAISAVARNLLQPNGKIMILRVHVSDPGREILSWRFLSLMLPASVLIAAASEEEFTPAEAVRLLSRSIAPGGDVAELHVHHAAMMSFEDVWASLHHTAVVMPGTLVKNLRHERARCPQLHPGTCPQRTGTLARSLVEQAKHIKHMTEWGDLLRQTFVARYVLRQHSWHRGVRLEHCKACESRHWRNDLRYFVQGQGRPASLTATPFPWQGYRVALERRWLDAKRPRSSGVERRSSEALRADAADERSYLSRAVAHVRRNAEEPFDLEFETLLIQYLRVKAAVFGLLVHPTGVRGLKEFRKHFSQIKVYAPEAEKLRPQPRNEPGLSVAATEYRVACDAWFYHRRRRDRSIEEDAPQVRMSESAWLIHLKRDAPGDKLPLFGSAVRKLDTDGDLIARALESEPAALRHLRGLDVAGVESDQPLWVPAETLRQVRERSQQIAARSARPGLAPLGLTLHVGEEFKWLTSGIRAIAEPIQWGLLLRGDRLGHAIAITVDHLKWWERNSGRELPGTRFERLLNLAFLAEYAVGRSSESETWLASEMRPIVSALWGEAEGAVSDRDLIRDVRGLWTILGTKRVRILMSRYARYTDTAPDKWLSRYLWSPSTQDRAQREIMLKIEASSELSLVALARKRVIRELARRQICIESNPTSNLVVAGLDAVAAQDVLHHRPTAKEKSGDETLTWTINSDDPVSFSTTLADEYAYAWAGMVLSNDPCDPSYARALLDEAAATSMRMRFTIPRVGCDRPAGDNRLKRHRAPRD